MSAFDAAQARGFLEIVFGGQPGLIQIGDPHNRVGQFFSTDPAGLDEATAYAAHRDTFRPSGIYVRITTLARCPEPGKRGGAADTLAVPTLWGDVDFGTLGHKGDDLPPDADAAQAVIAESALPEPTLMVHSGGGLYPLWLSSVELRADAAKAASITVQGLLADAHTARGWSYGTGVGDLSRVLRLPGSVNRKADTERPCRIIGGSGRKIDPGALPDPLTPPPACHLRAAPADYDPNRPQGLFDVLAGTTTWADLLEPADWTFVADEADDVERWLRPGDASSEYSARAYRHNLVCHSESAGLPPGSGQRLTKGRVFAHLHHGGDLSAAAGDLLAAATRGEATEAARALPATTLTAIRRWSVRNRMLPALPVPTSATPVPTPTQFMTQRF